MMRRNFYTYSGRDYIFKMLFKQASYFLPVLMRYQTHGYFCVGLTRDHSFCTFTCISAPNTVYIKSWTDGVPFIGGIGFFSIDILDIKCFFISIKIKRGFGHGRSFFLGKLIYLIVKSRYGNMVIFVMQRSNHFCQNVNWIGDSSTVKSGMKVSVWTRNFYFYIT